MAILTPPPPSDRDRGPVERGGRGSRPGGAPPTLLLVLAAVPLLALIGVCYWWFVQRVEVPAGKLLVLVRKVGDNLPGQFGNQVVLYPELLASLGVAADPKQPQTRYKGIVYQPLLEGRYFFDPFFWQTVVTDAVHIPQGEVGVMIRKYGDPLPPGKVVATSPHERGPLAEVLPPGRHNVNPFAFDIAPIPAVRIPEGFVGVQTLLSGPNPKDANRYVVEAAERGVQPDVLPPGLYYNNPYMRRIDLIELRTRTLDLRGDDAIHFPSLDSFMIVLEGTVQYAVRQDMAPYVMVAFGGHEDVVEKLILPHAQSLARIEGSKLLAREFISGESRTAFQDRVFKELRRQCSTHGIDIESTPIRKVVPPLEIADPISDRQVAGQQIAQFEAEIKVAQSQAGLVEQEEMQNQNKAIGEGNRDVVKLVVEAEQRKSVALTEANKRHEVAKLKLEAAREQAGAKIARGMAEAEIVRLGFEAQAKPLAEAVTAFGDGETYARFFFYQKLGPALKSVLDSTDGPFADIFRSLSQPIGPKPIEPTPGVAAVEPRP